MAKKKITINAIILDQRRSWLAAAAGRSSYLEVKFQTDKKWEGYCLQDTFLVQRMLHLFQLHDLGKNMNESLIK